MKVVSTDVAIAQIEADAVVVGIFAKAAPRGPAAEVDKATGGLIGRLVETKEITGAAGEAVPILGAAGVKAGQVVVVGLGEEKGFDRGAAFRAAGTAARILAGKERRRVAYYLADGWSAEQNEAGLAGAIVGFQGQDLYRAEKKSHLPAETLWAGGQGDAVTTGQILGECVNFARHLVNQPPQDIYPESFAAEAKQVADRWGLQIEIWDEHKLADERCEALLAVGRGSDRPPRLVVLRHTGGKQSDPVLALVGKGVTFDSGGYSIKPSDSMLTMKMDMAGAATVLASMEAIARLELPINVIGLMGLVENLVSGHSYKLGDVITARNGKTIEIHNTDAEGRVVLADVLAVAVDSGAAKVVDLATLTGACMVALGNDVAGLMSNDQGWCNAVAKAAADCGEQVWQLPMFAEYGEQIKSEVADIKNVGAGRWGGAITAAKFLEEFVDGRPWTHIDIAGPAFAEKPKPWIDAGASGLYVRTLVELARGWK